MTWLPNKIPAVLLSLFLSNLIVAGQDTTRKTTKPAATPVEKRPLKNIIRYDLSGGILFGVDGYIVLGYERMIGRNQSMSLNIGRAGLPKFFSVTTDSFDVSKDISNTGFNVSIDYRFYLQKENKYDGPHGLYIGPYSSYNYFHREITWNSLKVGSPPEPIHTTTDLKVWTIGAELGYQFLVWKRLAIDLVMIGPGISRYDLKGGIQSILDAQNRQELQAEMKQLITERFPGMNYVFSNKQFDLNGTIRTWNVGFRYIVHIGFAF